MAYRPKRTKACVMPDEPQYFAIGNKTKVKEIADVIPQRQPREYLPRNGDVFMCEVIKVTDGEGVYVILFSDNIEVNFEAFIPTDEFTMARKRRDLAIYSKRQVVISIGDQFPVVLMKVDKKSTGELYIDASKIEVNQVDPERVEYCKTKHIYEHPIREIVKDVIKKIRDSPSQNPILNEAELTSKIYREAIWIMEDTYQRAIYIYMRALHHPDILTSALEFPAGMEELSSFLVESCLIVFKKYTKLVAKVVELTINGIQEQNGETTSVIKAQDKIRKLLENSPSRIKLCCGSTVLNSLLTNCAQKTISQTFEDTVQQRRKMMENVCNTLKPWQNVLTWLFEDAKIHSIYAVEEVCRLSGQEGQLCKDLFHRILYILYQDLDIIDEQQLDEWSWSRENSSLKWCKDLEQKTHEMLIRLDIRPQSSPMTRDRPH